MSEMTQCNFCTLQDIRRSAKKRGATVMVKVSTERPWTGWTIVTQSDREHPHYFMAVTKECVC